MSYSRNYRESIRLSGSVKVDYPASENGGSTTAYWEHTEPISINITVDTSPFDSSVNNCNHHVVALGAAVGVMNAAQRAAIQQGAARISASLERGFFATIRTDLNAQMADLRNQFEARLALMVQQARSCKACLETMQRDFERIVSRYQDLFRNLDEENRRRVLELDRPSFRLADEVGETLLKQKRLSLAALSLTIARELGETQTLLVVSRIRRRALAMLNSARNHLVQERSLGRSMRDIVSSRRVEDRGSHWVPVLLMAADGSGGLTANTVTCPDGLSVRAAQAVTATVTRQMAEPGSWGWRPIPHSVRLRLQREFQRCVERRFGQATSEEDRRISTLMAQLWESSSAACVIAGRREK